MRMVPDWQQCWRWHSMRGMGAALVIINTWNVLPDKFQDAFPHWVVFALASVSLALGMVGRVRDQDPPSKPPITVPENRP